MPALDTHQRRDLGLLARLADFRSRGSKDDVLRALAHLFAHCVDLIERVLDGLRPRDFAGNPDGEENRAEPALFHARDIEAAARATCPPVKVSVVKQLR